MTKHIKTSGLKQQAEKEQANIQEQASQVTHPAPGSNSKPTVWTKEQQQEYADSHKRLHELNKKIERRPSSQLNRAAKRDDRSP